MRTQRFVFYSREIADATQMVTEVSNYTKKQKKKSLADAKGFWEIASNCRLSGWKCHCSNLEWSKTELHFYSATSKMFDFKLESNRIAHTKQLIHCNNYHGFVKNIDFKISMMSQFSGSLIGSNGFNLCKILDVISGFSTNESPLPVFCCFLSIFFNN